MFTVSTSNSGPGMENLGINWTVKGNIYCMVINCKKLLSKVHILGLDELRDHLN
jgi:hypothetical protein